MEQQLSGAVCGRATTGGGGAGGTVRGGWHRRLSVRGDSPSAAVRLPERFSMRVALLATFALAALFGAEWVGVAAITTQERNDLLSAHGTARTVYNLPVLVW